MAKRRSKSDNPIRRSIVAEAARILSEDGVSDLFAAKRKAAARIGAGVGDWLPSNAEVEAALREYQAVFRPDRQAQSLDKLRRIVLHAMEFLSDYSPRLTGSVLSGVADEHSIIELHLFADTVEEVGMFLLDHQIPFDTGVKRYRLASGAQSQYQQYSFLADGCGLEITIFPVRERSQPPVSFGDGKPIRRAGLAEVRKLLTDSHQ